ncbi:MAG: DUF1289 domain-containing protein [Pseudomonadales bacterium]
MANEHNKTRVASPCINVCVLNRDDICTGCYRSLKEITGWSRLADEEKRKVIARSWARARAAGGVL